MPLAFQLESQLAALQDTLQSICEDRGMAACRSFLEARSKALMDAASEDELPYVAFRIAQLRRQLVLPQLPVGGAEA